MQLILLLELDLGIDGWRVLNEELHLVFWHLICFGYGLIGSKTYLIFQLFWLWIDLIEHVFDLYLRLP
jgi:hypothetical protein